MVGTIRSCTPHRSMPAGQRQYSYEWQEVPAGASVPPGMAYTLPLEEGQLS
jgi:hypothetical protein